VEQGWSTEAELRKLAPGNILAQKFCGGRRNINARARESSEQGKGESGNENRMWDIYIVDSAIIIL